MPYMYYHRLKKQVVGIILTMISAIGLVFALAWVALRPVNQKNGFARKFISPELKVLDMITVEERITAVAGITETSVYYRTMDPAKLWVSDRNLKNGKTVVLNVPSILKKIGVSFCPTFVDSPTVYFLAGNGPAVIKADLNGANSRIKRFPTSLFTRAVIIGPDSYIFRGFDTTEKKAGQIFIKGNPETGELLRNKNVIPTNRDGAGIVTDGYLNYDKETNLVIHVSFYNNSVICMDTNLNLVHSWHTIDTVNTYQIKAGRVGNTVTNTSPARFVNGKSTVANKILYIMSKLQADNEDAKEFTKNVTIDAYSIEQGIYLGSFHIPLNKKNKIQDFKISKNQLFTVYKNNTIVVYELPSAFNKTLAQNF